MGQRMKRFRPDATTNPLFTVYECADGWIAIAALQSPQWPAIAKAAGLEHLLDDERFQSFGAVQRNAEEFRPVFAAHLRQQTVEHWWQRLRGCGAWVSKVNSLADLPKDENVVANEYLVTFDDGFIGPPVPFEVDGFRGVRGLAAEYGQHTDEVLAELGFSEDEILDLKVAEAIW